MTKAILPNESPPPDDSADELESLLGDALSAPPVPRSLMRRLDQGIEAQWGHSPGLVSKSTEKVWSKRIAGVSRSRVWPIAAGLAAALLLALVFASGSNSYAWATVLDAITGQTLLQIESSDGVRHLTFSDSADESVSKRSRLFIAFLLGENAAGRSSDAWNDLRVVDESWQRHGDAISLKIRFQAAGFDRLDLNLTLDPDTSLPRTARVIGSPSETESVVLSYPNAAEPSVAGSRLAKIARTETEANTQGDRDQVEATKALSEPDSTSSAAPAQSDLAGESVAATEISLPLGAATKWRSVSVVSRTDDEVLSQIDEILAELWVRESIQPVPVASDQELLRRVYLDLAGRTPTVTEVRSFLKDSRPDRYERLVNRLLETPDHASHLATTWRTFLIPEGIDLSTFGGREAFDRWLAERFAANEAYDEVVRRLLLAEGRLSQSGPLLFYSALKLDPDQLAARTSRVFLGMRLECAQCHDHPFEPWTQTDFWSYAAFFAQISRPKGELENVSKVMRVSDVDRGEVMLPETEMIVPPRFLSETSSPEEGESIVRRQQLARWLTGAANPYFARATVNRVWAQLFGRGIVDPVDDFGLQNPPLSPELLDLLASQLIDSHFDLRRVIRTIALSRAYRLSSGSDSPDPKRVEHFAQMDVKTLTAPQLYDCITVATLLDQANGNAADFTIARFGNPGRESFLQQFASSPDNRVEYLAGIPQALTLMNGGLVSSATGLSSSGLLKSLEAPFFSDDQRIEILFLATLARPPHPHELELLRQAIADGASLAERSEGLADILWALLNSAEFTLNH